MTVRVDGRLIRNLRIRHSYSQEKLAEIIGVNLRTIQRIETNGVASLSTRGALASAFNVRPEELDAPDATGPAAPAKERQAGLPRWPLLLLSAALVAAGWAVLAVSIVRATPIGLMTPQAVGGFLIAVTGFVFLIRLSPLGRRRTYSVLSIIAVAMIASPPAWTIQALVAISLWAALEAGILLTRFSSTRTAPLSGS